jgi:hypothetical protein
MAVKVTVDDIKSLMAQGKAREKEALEAAANKNATINQLENVKATLDQDEKLSADEIAAFKQFIDEIIEGNGRIPEKNPMKDFLAKSQEEIAGYYEMAKTILSQTKAGTIEW